MFKRIKHAIIFSIISTLTLTGCSIGGPDYKKANLANTTPLSETEFSQLFSDSSKLEGRRVDFFARIFTDPVKDDKGTYLEAYADDDHNKVTIIGINDTELGMKNGDIIQVHGSVGELDVEKFFGKTKVPNIQASEIEKYAYTPAFAPAVKTILVNKEINENGYYLKLNKVEVAKKETRLYISITNTTKDKVRFQSTNAKVTQGSKELKKLSNADEEIPDINSDILPGFSQNGVLIYEPIQGDGENLKVIFVGGSDDENLHLTPFTFDIALNK